MSPAARRFWWRYRLLTGLLPPYLAALLYYGGGWFMLHVMLTPGLTADSTPARLFWITAALLLGCTLTGGGYFFYTLGFLLSGVPCRVVPAAAGLLQRVDSLQSPALPQLRLLLLDLADVPFLGTASRRILYASRHSLQADDAALGCLLAHEQAHSQLHSRSLLLPGLSWLLALPLCWLTAHWPQLMPLLIPLLGTLHVSLLLRWRAMQSARCEAAADKLAAQAVGHERYIAALLPHLARFEQPGSTALRRSRLRGMGLGEAEIEAWLRDSSA